MSLLSRLIRRFRPQPVAPAGPEAQTLVDLREFIARQVAAGFADEGTILIDAAGAFDGEMDPATLRREAQRLLRAATADHRAAQREWPTPTDCDRLDAAFDALESAGIVARQHFTCCGTCGSSEIHDEMAMTEAAGTTVDGYVFYHVQDTDSAVEGDGLYLNYGASADGEAAALGVARTIVDQLEVHGLTTHWDGSWGQRIGVRLDWRRRR